jgi:Arc/MetJ family transcription regulator
MQRLSVAIDDALLTQAQRALGTRTKRETIEVALREATRRAAIQRALDLQGQVALDDTLEDLLARREEGRGPVERA